MSDSSVHQHKVPKCIYSDNIGNSTLLSSSSISECGHWRDLETATNLSPSPPGPSELQIQSSFPCKLGRNVGSQSSEKRSYSSLCYGKDSGKYCTYYDRSQRPAVIHGFLYQVCLSFCFFTESDLSNFKALHQVLLLKMCKTCICLAVQDKYKPFYDCSSKGYCLWKFQQ